MAELRRRAAAQAIEPSHSASPDAAAGVARRSRELEPWEREPIRALGRLLEVTRVAAGLSVEDLGPVAGSASSIRSIERGRVRTRASRLRPWLRELGVEPESVIERFRAVLAPERPDGRNAWKPVAPVERREPAAMALPPLEPHDQAALGAELWRIRVRARLTRPALAKRLGISRVTVWRVEHGWREASPELVDRWLVDVGRPADRVRLAFRFPGRIRATRSTGVGVVPPDHSRRAPTGRFVAKEEGASR